MAFCFMLSNKVKRPPNCWMIFLHDITPQLQQQGIMSRNELVKEASTIWKSLSDQDRAEYDKRQLLARKIHQEMHPDYKYQPKKRKRSK